MNISSNGTIELVLTKSKSFGIMTDNMENIPSLRQVLINMQYVYRVDNKTQINQRSLSTVGFVYINFSI